MGIRGLGTAAPRSQTERHDKHNRIQNLSKLLNASFKKDIYLCFREFMAFCIEEDMWRGGGSLRRFSFRSVSVAVTIWNLLCGLHNFTSFLYIVHTEFYALLDFRKPKEIFYTNISFHFIGIFIGFSSELLNFILFCVFFPYTFVWKMSSVAVIIYRATVDSFALYVRLVLFSFDFVNPMQPTSHRMTI